NYDYLGRGRIRRIVRLGKDSVCEILLVARLGKLQKLGFSEETSLLRSIAIGEFVQMSHRWLSKASSRLKNAVIVHVACLKPPCLDSTTCANPLRRCLKVKRHLGKTNTLPRERWAILSVGLV